MDMEAGKTLTNEEVIRELLELLKKNAMKEQANDVFEICSYVDGLEKKIDSMTEELTNMQNQIKEMQEDTLVNNAKKALSEAQERLNTRCEQIKSQVYAVKAQVESTAKSIVAEAKAKGRAALYRVSEFLGIKKKLLDIRENVRGAIKTTDKDIAKTALAPFDIKEVREITAYDELDLGDIGRRKTALFVIISDTDDSLNFLVSIMYTQLFNLLCTIADDEYHGKLPVHVRCILDEFANIGQIPKFDKLIATIRSREISASIILQSKAQLKSIYKDNAETIEGNCDTFLFLGGKEKSTLKDLSEVLGKETIDTYNTSDTRGTSQSYGLNYQKLGRELMSQDRLALMDGGKCILQVRGVRPFFSDKVDITAHEMYKELSDFDKKNQFDIEKYVSEYGRPKFSKKDKFIELDLTGVKYPDDLVNFAIEEAGMMKKAEQNEAAALQ